MIREALLSPNPGSRPGYLIRRVDAIVLHWVESPGGTAEQVRRYFESLKDGSRRASAHYIIDATETIRCIPEREVAYHVGQPGGLPYMPWAAAKWGGEHPNWYCLGIEHCHPDMTGQFEAATLEQSCQLAADLCRRYGLDPTDAIIRHYDVTGKACPRWYCEHPEDLVRYREAVTSLLGG